MLKKTITYEDFNGEEVSEDHFFHLSKAELVELEMSHDGGLSSALERIIAAQDGKSIIAEFKKIILGAYGKKSPDGRRFIKSQELRDEFESTEAYSTLFMELVTDTDASIKFINGIVPAGMPAEVAKLSGGQTDTPELAAVPDATKEPQILTKADIARMSSSEVAQLGARITAGEVKLSDDPADL